MVRYRFSEDVIEKLLDSIWWELPDTVIKEAATEFKDPIKFLENVNTILKKSKIDF